MSGYDSVKSNVLSGVWKVATDGADVTSGGRQFHTLVPATKNARRPNQAVAAERAKLVFSACVRTGKNTTGQQTYDPFANLSFQEKRGELVSNMNYEFHENRMPKYSQRYFIVSCWRRHDTTHFCFNISSVVSTTVDLVFFLQEKLLFTMKMIDKNKRLNNTTTTTTTTTV